MGKETENFKMVAKTFKGLEDVLADELKQLGASKIKIGIRAVEFEGDKKMMYRANFHLRTALRILKPIANFKVKDENELYDAIQTIDWTNYFGVKDTFAIDGVVHSNYFSHSKYVALKAKDAIVDQFREKFGKRPYVEVDDPDIQLSVHISEDKCDILLDSSGESLHKRGYRIRTTKAPLNEVLAAGMILLSGWDKKSDFIDPMCGSGTLAIEAAMIAYGISPGIYRNRFGFESWLDFDADLLEDIYEEESAETPFEYNILGSDVSEIAIRIARENAQNASLAKKIKFLVKPIENYSPKGEKGIVVTNPPYGERVKKNEINNFYKLLGDRFKQSFKGYDIWLLSNNFEAIKHIGLHPSNKLTLFNGALECKFLEYSIYEGSKKDKNTNQDESFK